MCLKVCKCDPNGNPHADEREFVFSKMTLISDVIKGICSYFRCSHDSAKLWNYASREWKEQKLISDTSKTLVESGLRDGQSILLEVALGDGTWPRSQRQADLEGENKDSETNSMKTSTSLTSLVSASNVSAGGGLLSGSRFPNSMNLPQSPRLPLNKGRVGIDNLGNTCYMSSSLQVLLHTDQLVEYFMRKAYLKHVNIHSIHGYKGRLAHTFGKLVNTLWCTDKSSVSPRTFRQELVQIRDQFAGNEQHDAQELMIFLLDGLSEDVNLVHEKPYIENPDSENRSDEELANIWWSNHLQRENSVVQALFTGQFKSVIRCGNCEHSSARFEPFNSLSLPLLEDHTQTLYIDVVTLGCKFRLQRCVVTVKRTETLQEVVDTITDIDYGLLGLSVSAPHFLAVDMMDSRIREFHPLTRSVKNILSNETVVFYEVEKPFMSPTVDSAVSEPDSTAVENLSSGSNVLPPNLAENAAEGGSPASAHHMEVVPDIECSEPVASRCGVLKSDEEEAEVLSRVVVLQRRAKFLIGMNIYLFY